MYVYIYTHTQVFVEGYRDCVCVRICGRGSPALATTYRDGPHPENASIEATLCMCMYIYIYMYVVYSYVCIYIYI